MSYSDFEPWIRVACLAVLAWLIGSMYRTLLRDYIAAKAMAGMWASDRPGWECSCKPEALEQRAQLAYLMADAMLKAKEKK